MLLSSGCSLEEAHAPNPCESPALLVRKNQATLELWCGKNLTRSFPATFGANPVGPKQQEGDERTPEGRYVITEKHPSDRFYKFLGVSYPNATDRRRGADLGITNLGGSIGIHGIRPRWAWAANLWIPLGAWSGLSSLWGPTDGCIGLRNADVDVVDAAVRIGTPVTIEP